MAQETIDEKTRKILASDNPLLIRPQTEQIQSLEPPKEKNSYEWENHTFDQTWCPYGRRW